MHPNGRPLDTSPEAWERSLESIRRMSMAEKFKRTMELSDMVRSLARAGVRRQYPEASEDEITVRTAVRWLGRETVIRVYGWDPESNDPFPGIRT